MKQMKVSCMLLATIHKSKPAPIWLVWDLLSLPCREVPAEWRVELPDFYLRKIWVSRDHDVAVNHVDPSGSPEVIQPKLEAAPLVERRAAFVEDIGDQAVDMKTPAECLCPFVVRCGDNDEPLVVQPVVRQCVLENVIEVDAHRDAIDGSINHHRFTRECRGCRIEGQRSCEFWQAA